MSNKIRVASFSIVSLLIAAMITRDGDLIWMAIPFLVYLGIGVFNAPRRETLFLTAAREIDQTRENGKNVLKIRVTVQNGSPETVNVHIQDVIKPDVKILDGHPGCWVTLQPNETAEICYTHAAIRGNYEWQAVHVLACDPLGLIDQEMTLPAAGSAQIQPEVHKFKTIRLRPRSTLHSPGSIPARLGGSGTDFYGVREYQPGDPLRSLDWRMTARHPFKFFTKEFEQEEIADIGLILDARQNTELRIGEASLFEHGVTAAASLAKMFLHQGHRLSLLVFGRRMSIVYPGYGKTQLNRVMSCLSKARVETEGRASAHIDFLPVRMFPNRALIIVISPLISGDETLYKRLRAYGYQAMLVSPDTIQFSHELYPRDINSELAIRTARIERKLRLNSISQLRVPVIDWQVDQPLYPLVRNALTRSCGQGSRA